MVSNIVPAIVVRYDKEDIRLRFLRSFSFPKCHRYNERELEKERCFSAHCGFNGSKVKKENYITSKQKHP